LKKTQIPRNVNRLINPLINLKIIIILKENYQKTLICISEMSLLEKFGSFDIDPQKVETLDSEEILLIADLNLYVL
jgi:hypothetical protein